MRSLAFATVVAAALGATPLAHARLVRSGNKANVVFTAKGPGGMSIVGSTSDSVICDDGKTVLITVPLKDLTTGIALRDRHLREKYLQVDKFPVAEPAIDRASLRAPQMSAVALDLKGLMKIHGKTKAVSVHYSATKSGKAIEVTGATHLDIRDYGIEIPSFLGVTVKPDVDISVTFEGSDS